MRLTRRDFGFGTAATALALSASATAQPAKGADAQLTAFLDAEFEAALRQSPEQLTRLGRKELYDKLSDPTDAAADRGLTWRRGLLRRPAAGRDHHRHDRRGDPPAGSARGGADPR